MWGIIKLCTTEKLIKFQNLSFHRLGVIVRVSEMGSSVVD